MSAPQFDYIYSKKGNIDTDSRIELPKNKTV